jgi:hypothetical protein
VPPLLELLLALLLQLLYVRYLMCLTSQATGMLPPPAALLSSAQSAQLTGNGPACPLQEDTRQRSRAISKRDSDMPTHWLQVGARTNTLSAHWLLLGHCNLQSATNITELS